MGEASITEHSWSLVSNSGRERVRWLARAIEKAGAEAALRCDIFLEGRYFGASLDSEAADDPADFRLEIRGLSVRITTLERLHDHLKRWLDLPLSELRRTRLDLDCDMGGLFDQQLRLIVGERPDVLSSGHPVATVKYIVGRMSGEMAFVTDQSCLSGLRMGIGEILQSLTRPD